MNSHFAPYHDREGCCWCLPIVVLTPRERQILREAGALPVRYVVSEDLPAQSGIITREEMTGL